MNSEELINEDSDRLRVEGGVLKSRDGIFAIVKEVQDLKNEVEGLRGDPARQTEYAEAMGRLMQKNAELSRSLSGVDHQTQGEILQMLARR